MLNFDKRIIHYWHTSENVEHFRYPGKFPCTLSSPYSLPPPIYNHCWKFYCCGLTMPILELYIYWIIQCNLFVSHFFLLEWFLISSMLLEEAIVCSLTMLSSFPLYKYNVSCLFIHFLLDIWVVFNFGLFWMRR